MLFILNNYRLLGAVAPLKVRKFIEIPLSGC